MQYHMIMFQMLYKDMFVKSDRVIICRLEIKVKTIYFKFYIIIHCTSKERMC